jgi:hypothetical protein
MTSKKFVLLIAALAQPLTALTVMALAVRV